MALLEDVLQELQIRASLSPKSLMTMHNNYMITHVMSCVDRGETVFVLHLEMSIGK